MGEYFSWNIISGKSVIYLVAVKEICNLWLLTATFAMDVSAIIFYMSLLDNKDLFKYQMSHVPKPQLALPKLLNGQ